MMLVTFKPETVPEGTRITVTEQGFEQLPGDLPETPSKRNAQGLTIALDRLAEYMREPDNG